MKNWLRRSLFIMAMVLFTGCSPLNNTGPTEETMGVEVDNLITPEITAETNVGAQLPVIFYEDDERIAFYNHLGIFIYNTKKQEMEQAFNVDDEQIKVGFEGDQAAKVASQGALESIYILPVTIEGESPHYYVYRLKQKKAYRMEIATSVETNPQSGDTENQEGIADHSGEMAIIGGADGMTDIVLDQPLNANTEYQDDRFTSATGYCIDLKFMQTNPKVEHYPFKKMIQ